MELKTIIYNLKGILYFSTILILLAVLSIQTNTAHASSSLIINEILYDPAGTDLGNEWIELYNPLATDLILKDWKIQIAGNTFSTAVVLPSVTIPSRDYVTICELNVTGCTLNVPKIGLQNGGSESDGIQLLDNKNNVVDTVIYDAPNTNNLTSENGITIPNENAAIPSGSGKSIGRKNHIDTDNSYNDFYLFDEPSPGLENTLSDELAPTGQYPILIGIILLFILLTYSDRLNRNLLNLLISINAKRKK